MVSDKGLKVLRIVLMIVLILVVMEYGLRLKFDTTKYITFVLILVVMEYGLRLINISLNTEIFSLNPCCNGIWSQTRLSFLINI